MSESSGVTVTVRGSVTLKIKTQHTEESCKGLGSVYLKINTQHTLPPDSLAVHWQTQARASKSSNLKILHYRDRDVRGLPLRRPV